MFLFSICLLCSNIFEAIQKLSYTEDAELQYKDQIVLALDQATQTDVNFNTVLEEIMALFNSYPKSESSTNFFRLQSQAWVKYFYPR